MPTGEHPSFRGNPDRPDPKIGPDGEVVSGVGGEGIGVLGVDLPFDLVTVEEVRNVLKNRGSKLDTITPEMIDKWRIFLDMVDDANIDRDLLNSRQPQRNFKNPQHEYKPPIRLYGQDLPHGGSLVYLAAGDAKKGQDLPEHLDAHVDKEAAFREIAYVTMERDSPIYNTDPIAFPVLGEIDEADRADIVSLMDEAITAYRANVITRKELGQIARILLIRDILQEDVVSIDEMEDPNPKPGEDEHFFRTYTFKSDSDNSGEGVND